MSAASSAPVLGPEPLVAAPEPAWRATFATALAADPALAPLAGQVELVELAGMPTLRGHVPSAEVRKRLAMTALRAVRSHVEVQVEVDAPAVP